MLRIGRWAVIGAVLALGLVGACKKKEAGPLERAGAKLDRALEKAADKTERALDEAADETADALDDAADAVEDVGDDRRGG